MYTLKQTRWLGCPIELGGGCGNAARLHPLELDVLAQFFGKYSGRSKPCGLGSTRGDQVHLGLWSLGLWVFSYYLRKIVLNPKKPQTIVVP